MKIDNDYEQHGNDGTRCAWNTLIRLGPNLRSANFFRTVQVQLDQNRQPLESCEPDPLWDFMYRWFLT